MKDLTAWIELWEVEPGLVPPRWERSASFRHEGWWRCVEDADGLTVGWSEPSDPDPIDIAAQIGTAFVWLSKREGVTLFPDFNDDTLAAVCREELVKDGRLTDADH